MGTGGRFAVVVAAATDKCNRADNYVNGQKSLVIRHRQFADISAYETVGAEADAVKSDNKSKKEQTRARSPRDNAPTLYGASSVYVHSRFADPGM